MDNRQFSASAGILGLAALLQGCAGTRTVTDLEGVLPDTQFREPHHQTMDDLLQDYFTQQAYAAIKDIPLIDGPTFGGGYAAGTTVLSNISSFLTFNGVGRKVVLSSDVIHQDTMGTKAIVHEYIHHLDDMGHDGEGEFIDHDAFIEAYRRMQHDSQFAGIAIWTEREVMKLGWFTNIFGVCDISEVIAYVGSYLVTEHRSPDYMKQVFERIFRREVLYPQAEH